MPVEASASIRVNVPELKAEIEIECLPHNSFWHLKLCLVDGILSKGQAEESGLSASHKPPPPAAVSTTNDRQKRPPLMQLVAKGLTGRKADKIGNKSCMQAATSHASLTSASIADRCHRSTSSTVATTTTPVPRCHSSASSLSSTDASSASSAVRQRDQVNHLRSQSQGRLPSISSPAFYYGFTGAGRSAWNGSDPNDLAKEEEAALRALVQATGDESNGYYAASDTASTIDNHNEYCGRDSCQQDDQANNRRISNLLELDERSDNDEYNIYECLRFGKLASEDHSFESKLGDSGNSSVHKITDDDNISDIFGKLDAAKSTSADRKLFEQILASGYMNYGFYSFSLAKFIDDQISLTEYLTLVSSSTGTSYYLDLEFKLKQRQLGPLASSRAYSPAYNGNAHYALRLTANGKAALSQTYSQVDVVNRLTYNSANTNPNSDVISLKLNRLPSLSSLHSRIKRTNSISTIGTNESRGSRGSNINISDQHNFTNNMIAKLASGGSHKSSTSVGQATKNSSAIASAAPSSASSSQCKRKRQKLLDLLLNTNWSKQSQQAANLIKLNKVLLVCDANFLDEKTGESPLSLAITSSQINATPTAANSANRLQSSTGHALASSAIGCPQSASLFNLQFQHPSTSHNQLTLQQTSAADISQSKVPLVEKILLLLIKSGALIDFRNNDGRTPLHVAAMKSNSWALKTLLDQGASTDYRDINGLTPLYYSILHRAELKVTQLLLNHMSNKSLSASQANEQNGVGSKAIGICDQQGWQEVHHACKLGLDAHLDKLLYHGCDINAKISGSGNTPLHVAAINDQLEVAKVLLLRGADRSITNNSHQTAHQVAVISNNMDLAEFIASHDNRTVVPFAERPINRHSLIPLSPHNSNDSSRTSNRFSMPPNQHLVSSRSSNQISNLAKIAQGQTPTVIVQPQGSHEVQLKHLNPLTLDVACHYSNGAGSAGSSAPSTGTSGTGHHTGQSSLLSINSSSQNHHLDAQSSNISPSLSQRSCGTSNTTSSGVCCDGEGNNSDTVAGVKTHQSNVTVISIGKTNNSGERTLLSRDASNHYDRSNRVIHPPPPLNPTCNGESSEIDSAKLNDIHNYSEAPDDDDLSSSESSGNGLHSLMSANRPLFAGSIVEATTDYQSGDPSHLQLRREDLIEVLEYPQELLQGGQLPQLANKPMLYGRRQTDGASGLFPSFCVRRTKQRQSSLRHRIPMSDLTNSSSHQLQQHTHKVNGTTTFTNEQPSGQAIRGTNLPISQSMAAIGDLTKQPCENSGSENLETNQEGLKFKEYQVTLTKINDGFGFVLRGARINPATLSAQSNISNGRIAIDERLMIANNLASLQYLDDIEMGSVAQRAGLKRGDFLIAVNNQDVRLCSHENVVQMIRSSGDRVHLTIATPVMPSPYKEIYSSKTLGRVKPEPPKRDPTTTLTRNKSQKVRSMPVAPQIQHQQQTGEPTFDANKPLPRDPGSQHINSPRGSANLDCSRSAVISHLDSTTSSCAAPDTQSITSISTVGSVDNQGHQVGTVLLSRNNPNQDQSSSSTATLTTVATTKPEAPAKPNSIYLKGLAIQNSLTQSNYQSAAVMTSNRRKIQEQNDPMSRGKLPPKPTAITQPSQLPPPPPPLPTSLPPPPPPLPDFNNENILRLNQRRTSAPVNQPQTTEKSNRLLKKRESFAVVTTDRHSDGPAPICTVAAACAAAANNRLQRQQQKEDEAGQHQTGEQSKGSAARLETDPEPTQDAKPAIPAGFDGDIKKRDETIEAKTSVNTTKYYNHESQTTNASMKREQAARVMQSATLGRKSSAQIIQQPKQQCPVHSQTLRAINTPKRMSILDYEMSQLPPPPPVPTQPFVLPRQIPQDLQQNMHHHRHHSHQKIADENLSHRSVIMNRSQHELAQRELQSQHQLILRQSQQLRQQQLIQERLMVHQQAQHRICHHNHGLSSGHGYAQQNSYLVAEPTGPANNMHHHHLHTHHTHHNHHPHQTHHAHAHRKQHHQPISMDAPSYLVNQIHALLPRD